MAIDFCSEKTLFGTSNATPLPKTGTVMFLYRSSALRSSFWALQKLLDASDPSRYLRAAGRWEDGLKLGYHCHGSG